MFNLLIYTNLARQKWLMNLFKFFLASLFPLIVLSASGQVIAIGYRSHFGGMEAYQNVVRYYNENRPWLNQEMSPSTYMHGFEIGLGGSRQKYGYTIGRFYTQYLKTQAQGTSNGQTYDRTIKTRIYGVEIIDFWFTPFHIRNYNLGLGLMPTGLGFMRINTELNGVKKRMPLTDFYAGILSSSHLYMNVHLDLTKVTKNQHSWQLQFFTTIGPKQEYELLYLNQEINPNSFDKIGRRTMMKVNNSGLKLIFSY